MADVAYEDAYPWRAGLFLELAPDVALYEKADLWLAGVPDTTPPAASASPPGGSTVTKTDTITIDVTDNLGAIGQVVLLAELTGRVETLYNGSTFPAPYSGSSRSTITNGYRYALARSGGWPNAAMTLRAAAVDASGNAVSVTFAYTVSNPSDAAAPVVSATTPASGSTILHTASITYDVTDDGGALALLNVVALFSGGGSELVFSGGAFAAPYSAGSTVSAITNGYRLVIVRTAGWQFSTLTFDTFAVDTSGNSTAGTSTFTVSDPVSAVAPTITNLDPAAGSAITADQAISFRVSDETGLLFVEVQIDQLRREVAHDGDSFLPPYTHSTRTTVSARVWDYVITRDGGWVVAPTPHVRVFDTSGNQSS